ncbi:hypothetical protein K1719_019920 [Acacia pycnantha]|nr:hypothetical protein K1719_019920 [Acacia pycnantha]
MILVVPEGAAVLLTVTRSSPSHPCRKREWQRLALEEERALLLLLIPFWVLIPTNLAASYAKSHYQDSSPNYYCHPRSSVSSSRYLIPSHLSFKVGTFKGDPHSTDHCPWLSFLLLDIASSLAIEASNLLQKPKKVMIVIQQGLGISVQ